MYLRTTKRKNKDGTETAYFQIAENYWNPVKKCCQTRVIYNVGRADEANRERLRRLAKSILTRLAPEEIVAENPDFKLIDSWEYGSFYALGELWARLGIRDTLEKALKRAGREVPLERAIFAMVTNRCLAPASKLYCYEQWMQEDIYWPEVEQVALHHLYRAMDFLEANKEKIEENLYWQLADLVTLEVDLIFYDTTSLYFEIDEEDWPDRKDTGLRKRGYSKDHRPDAPQVVVGLAVTRDGIPVRSWIFPGNTTDVTTIARVKQDLRSWKLNRCVFVSDAGTISDDNLKELSLSGGRYIVAMPLWKGHEVSEQVLTRPGRYHNVGDNLQVKEVWVPSADGGERRRRYVICYNPQEALRQKQRRQRLLAELEQELISLENSQEPHPKAACALVNSRRYGPYLRKLASGKLKLDKEAVKRAESRDGKWVIHTNDDTLSVEDLALGYKQLMRVEEAWRSLKSGNRIRPIFHRLPHRIKAHVLLCVLALTLERIAENACQDTWRNIRDALKQIKIAQLLTPNGTIFQTNQIRPKPANILKKLRIKQPPQIVKVL